MNIHLKQAIIIPLLLLMMQTLQAADIIGKITFIRGSVAAKLEGEESRILGKNAPIYQGDNIQTSIRSFVIIIFNDGTKITVRPNSSFSINEYTHKQGKQIAKMELHKGGIRANSGKNNPNNFQIKTPLATVNTKEADYSVRLCKNDCEEDAKKIKNQKITNSKIVVARVAKIKGIVIAKNNKKQEKNRTLVLRSPLYTGDYLRSQESSYAVLAFRDGGRITIHEKTEYEIVNYKYKQKNQEDKSFHKLIIGGMRVLTGHIGKLKKENYKINTPVATIGIRGTGFDLHCIGDCKTTTGNPSKQTDGLYTQVWLGSIDQQNQAGNTVLNAPDNNYIANENSMVMMLSNLPTSILQNLPIRPDKISINQERLFKITVLKGIPPGLYVTVHEGYVQLNSAELDLGKDETGYVNPDKQMMRLKSQPFQEYDSYPLPSKFNESRARIGKYSLLTDDFTPQTAPTYECIAE